MMHRGVKGWTWGLSSDSSLLQSLAERRGLQMQLVYVHTRVHARMSAELSIDSCPLERELQYRHIYTEFTIECYASI